MNVDWQAYMEQVALWRHGGAGGGMQMDYAQLRGGTGPLVYPAGFLYLYAALQWLAGAEAAQAPYALAGGALLRVQAAYLAAYLATLFAALRLLRAVLGSSPRAPPPAVALLLVVSYRLHSLYTLRLFNDCWSALAVFGAVALVSERQWLAGVLLWSAGVSVKMNGLLLLPALGLVLLRNTGPVRTAGYLAAALALQALLAAPFLAAPSPAPQNYLGRAFQLGRESRVGDVEADRTQGFFLHLWSVNWGFVPSPVFVAPWFARALLGLHLATLLALAHLQWCGSEGLWASLARMCAVALGREGPAAAAHRQQPPRATPAVQPPSMEKKRKASPSPAPSRAPQPPPFIPAPPPSVSLASLSAAAYEDTPSAIALALLSANFVGIAFARSLHYQFFTWYSASLPALAWGAAPRLPTWARLLALGCIEVGVSFAARWGTCVVSGVAARDCAPWESSLLVTGGHAVLLAGMLLGGKQ